jgi:putative heme-binding domain-containing protein
MSSLAPENVETVLDSLLSDQGARPLSEVFVEDVFGQLAMMGDDATIARALERVTESKANTKKAWQLACLATTLDALSLRGWSVDEKLDAKHRQALAETLESARRLTADSNALDSVRAAAVRLLLRESRNEAGDREILQQLLSPQTSVGIQQAVVRFLAGRADPEVAELLLAGWKSRSPVMRSEVLSVLASRDAWVDALLTRMEDGDVSPAEIDLPLRQRLLATRDANRQSRLEKVFQIGTTADRAAIISAYRPTVARAGDSARGKAVFEKRCATCHRQGTLGYEVGPNLASLTTKTPESLLTAILDPSAAVEAKYLNFVVVTKDGRALTGLLATETASSITLLAAVGKTETVLRSDIEELQSTGKSLMPDGLEKELTPEDVRDVIAFVAESDSRKTDSK